MDDILSRMQNLNLPHDVIRHDVTMTVDEQAQALQGRPGSVTKNIFLKDKKGRLYLITALPSTTIELKSLAARFGASKGSLRLAPDDLLTSILNVPLGSVTPLSLCAPTATDVVFLLDKNIQNQSIIYVHPLDNSASLPLAPSDLETFIQSLNRDVVYIDFEAVVKIDRENPPDLKWIVDAARCIVNDDDQGEDNGKEMKKKKEIVHIKSTKDDGDTREKQQPLLSASIKGEKSTKKNSNSNSHSSTKPGSKHALNVCSRKEIDVDGITETILNKIASNLDVDVSTLQSDVLRKVKADVLMELNILRNASYSLGFQSAKSTVVSHVTGKLN